ncbi:hypothetical protein FXF51_24660 [Nonomuraea sp. PA05]|uniref:hypothetical protein n=1 Tax=Nonomuraea sp. PA05 TaxID=2604466 RepID=UPI0011DBC297|nr:hypothetical protein [Nonomuraea sp. PA05]TYB62636.1 hypothetical protein FXF51_24660 [Nonomuraea sp. PA05]
MSAIARSLAGAGEEQDLQNIHYIASARQATTPSRPAGDASVHLIQMEGNFQRHVRHAEAPLRGTYMMILIDAETGQVTDWSISPQPFDLRGLGRAVRL